MKSFSQFINENYKFTIRHSDINTNKNDVYVTVYFGSTLDDTFVTYYKYKKPANDNDTYCYLKEVNDELDKTDFANWTCDDDDDISLKTYSDTNNSVILIYAEDVSFIYNKDIKDILETPFCSGMGGNYTYITSTADILLDKIKSKECNINADTLREWYYDGDVEKCINDIVLKLEEL